MQKISGIIPSSTRVTAVDLKDSSPVRSGAPGFGRKTFSPENRLSKSNVDAALSRDMIGDAKFKDIQNSKVVSEMASDFFMHKTSNIEAAVDGVDPVEVDYADDTSGEGPEFLAPGSYLDVKA